MPDISRALSGPARHRCGSAPRMDCGRFCNGQLIARVSALPLGHARCCRSPRTSGAACWLGDREGLYRWDGASLDALACAATVCGPDAMTSLRGDRSGRVWLDFNGRAIGPTRHGRHVPPARRQRGLRSLASIQTRITRSYEDDAGVVWLGASAWLAFASTSAARRRQSAARRVCRAIACGRWSRTCSAGCGSASIAVWCGCPREEIAKASCRSAHHQMQYQLYDPLDGLAAAPIGIIIAARAARPADSGSFAAAASRRSIRRDLQEPRGRRSPRSESKKQSPTTNRLSPLAT